MSGQMSEAQRRGRIGGLTYWSKVADRTAATAPARRGFLARIEREVETEFPDASPEARAQMVETRYRLHFLRMAEVKRQKKEAALRVAADRRVRRSA